MIKRLVALFLVLLLSIESFGAVVSDNDGSAFITKAEFDSLKNNFQSQIDQYNTSIDSKIDGAIASYLAGIKVDKETKLNAIVENYDNIHWMNGLFEKTKRRTYNISTGDTYTDASAAEWRRPLFRNQRFLRYARLFMTTAIAFNGTIWGIEYYLSKSTWAFGSGDQSFVGHAVSNVDADGQWGIGTKLIELNESGNGQWVYNLNGDVRFMEEECMDDMAYSSILEVDETGPHSNTIFWPYRTSNGAWGFYPDLSGGTWFKDIAKNPEDFSAFAFRMRLVNTSPGWTGYYIGYDVHLTPANTNYGGPMQWGNNDLTHYRSRYNTIETNFNENVHGGTGKSSIRDPYRDTYVSNAQITADKDNFNLLMLGIDDNSYVNVGYRKPSSDSFISRNLRFSFATAPKVSYVPDGGMVWFSPGGLGQANYGTWNITWGFNQISWTDAIWTDKPTDVKLPLWNRVTVNNLVNDNFKNGSTSLAIGQGLPIAKDVVGDGTIQLKIKYQTIDSDVSSTTTPSNKVKL